MRKRKVLAQDDLSPEAHRCIAPTNPFATKQRKHTPPSSSTEAHHLSLPDELVCALLEALPERMQAVAARTCRQWFHCCSSLLRNKLYVHTLCGSLSLFQWAVKEQGLHLNARVSSLVAHKGDMEVMQWAREQGCAWSELTCALAAKAGRLEMLKWLRENGCPWNQNTLFFAVQSGHLEVVQWAWEQGCHWDSALLRVAANKGHLHVLKWAKEHWPSKNEDLCFHAADNGHLEVLKWARENGCPWDSTTSTVAAIRGIWKC
ncbi:SecA trasnlocase/ankyrin repeat domain-containing protein [Balamuthia mandrillaris]